MSNQSNIFESRLSKLSSENFVESLRGIKHGVERETLRVTQEGSISPSSHPQALGSALTHDYITTDFSEALLEFITPPELSVRTSLSQLIDIHKYTYESIGDELLWPMSMPCFISSDTKIPIARYGQSNVAKMKEVYRKGLHHRYGSMMQVISGVHFNFSLPEEFWQLWCEMHGQEWNKHTQSQHYFSLIRNFRRFAWLIPYLYGASPALCGSFISHKQNIQHEFEKLAKGTLYLPHATSLRMSDLGYTSNAQASLKICYNELDSYVNSLRHAIGQHEPNYAEIGCSDEQGWDQLNSNILQIENELYSPIRPKQVARSNEMPTNALEDRGISYIEVRCLDVNPFSPIGIDKEQFYFLDVFLLYCLLKPSALFEESCYAEHQSNLNNIVLRGREPNLMLSQMGKDRSMQAMGAEMLAEMSQVAVILDNNSSEQAYSQAVDAQKQKLNDPSLTLSGRWLDTLIDNQIDNSRLGLELAKEYKQHVSQMSYKQLTKQAFQQQAKESALLQKSIEQSDDKTFSRFVAEYFNTRKHADVSC